ncbi:hypothetical protein KTQ42_04910|uniref:hypothetical protein n=1 Tax=Noviherbaspirillum sp. L7-7A TaxID=2850560 RepID=UPI001C2CC069|nr:hypothetical protein [Noviherbaspirillum sp. L7-7A]MBV0878641.1 hypothetical protein [Noviherbaspirillum sp. L7-7A]
MSFAADLVAGTASKATSLAGGGALTVDSQPGLLAGTSVANDKGSRERGMKAVLPIDMRIPVKCEEKRMLTDDAAAARVVHGVWRKQKLGYGCASGYGVSGRS